MNLLHQPGGFFIHGLLLRLLVVFRSPFTFGHKRILMAHSQDSTSLLDASALHGLRHARVAIVQTEWNDKIVSGLEEGCREILQQFQAHITQHFYVPGCIEIPFACQRIWQNTDPAAHDTAPEAIIALGAVIRGGTPHFDYVCQSVTYGISQLNISLPVPVIFGILTLDNEQQAWERLGGTHGHKGKEAALTALKMIHINRQLSLH